MGYLADLERDRRRQQALAERAARALERERLKKQREAERNAAADEKARKAAYVASREDEVQLLNETLKRDLAALASLLQATLSVDDFIDIESLKPVWIEPQFDPGALAARMPGPVLKLPDAPTGFTGLFRSSKNKHAEEVAAAETRHEQAVERHKQKVEQRDVELAKARRKHEVHVESLRNEHREVLEKVDAFGAALLDKQPEAVADYFGLVLEASRYPNAFPRWHRLAYVPESRQLVVELELPSIDCVPEAKTFRYVKARDEITSTAATAKDRKTLYASVVAQMALRTVHELFEADGYDTVDVVVLNCLVDAVDPRTGRSVRPCLVSVRTTRQEFEEINLARVEATACLKALGAGVSTKPSDLAPVRPVLEFDMVDSRFIDEVDVIGALDTRPNLMELTPSEFEGLIANLFDKMGLDTKQTQASRDGGVDCVAYDPRPVLGGKVVIQAKRYRNTVGVSAIRDLFGTMQNEGASKGILVTTSGYGPASFAFAEGKPLELLSGTNLLYLLEEHAGITARIEVPDEWRDPEYDAGE